jgi:DNA topoisomerase-1
MDKSLVIVESPAKAKTINKYLGSKFIVKASLGHIKDLPKKGLGVDIKKDFKPDYQDIPSKKKVIKELESAASRAEAIYIATDPDREGEAIGAHLVEKLGSEQHSIYRVLFNEITPKAIRDPSRTRAKSTIVWLKLNRLAVSWTAWWDTRLALCSGLRSDGGLPLGGFRR